MPNPITPADMALYQQHQRQEEEKRRQEAERREAERQRQEVENRRIIEQTKRDYEAEKKRREAAIIAQAPQDMSARDKFLYEQRGVVSEFKPKENWEPWKRNADGEVSHYIDPGTSIVYYAPGSTMWDLGWRVAGKFTKNPDGTEGMGPVTEGRVRGELNQIEKNERDAARKTFDKYLKGHVEGSNTASEERLFLAARAKLDEFNLLTLQRGTGFSLSTWIPGEFSGRTIDKFTVTQSQAKKIKELASAQDWDKLFKYERSIGMLPRESLSPNERKRVESLVRLYITPNGKYDLVPMIKDIAEGRTMLNFNDIRLFFGKNVADSLKIEVGKFKQKVRAFPEIERKNLVKDEEGAKLFRDMVRGGEIPKDAKFVGWDPKTLTVTYSTSETTTIYIDAKGNEVDKSVIDNAKRTLEPFKNADDSYNLRKALIAGNAAKTNREQLEIIDSIETLISPDIVQKLRQKYPALFIAGKGGFGESSPYEASIPAPIVGALGATRQTSLPHDDLVVGLIAGAIWGTTKAVAEIRKWKDNHSGKNPTINDIALLETGDNITRATLVDTKKFLEEGGLHQLIPPYGTQEEITRGTELKPTDIAPTRGTVLKQPEVILKGIPGFYGNANEMVFLPTPGDIREAGDNFLLAGLKAKVAENNEVKIRTNLNDALLDVGINLPVKYQKPETAIVTKEYYDKVKDLIQAHGKDITPDKQRRIRELLGEYRGAYEEYLIKRRIYEDAKKQFVASLSPATIEGYQAKEALASLVLAKVYEKDKISAESDIEREIKTLLEQLVKTYEKVYTKAITDNLTVTQARIKANQAVQEQIREMAKQAELTQTKTLTKTQISKLTDTATDEFTRTREAVRENTKTAEKTITKTTGKFPPPRGTAESKKRQSIKEGYGGFFYTRGKLEAPVHHVWFVDKNGHLAREIIQGAPPEGVSLITGKGSARTSLRRTGKGKRLKPFNIIEDTGASDTIISSDGKTLSISFHGNITGKGANISGPRPRISSGIGRISPRMPRLR